MRKSVMTAASFCDCELCYMLIHPPLSWNTLWFALKHAFSDVAYFLSRSRTRTAMILWLIPVIPWTVHAAPHIDEVTEQPEGGIRPRARRRRTIDECTKLGVASGIPITDSRNGSASTSHKARVPGCRILGIGSFHENKPAHVCLNQ